MNRRLFVLTALALGGCASVGPQPAVAPASRTFAELEPLYSATAGREGLTISVASNGCTGKPDFAFYVEQRRGQVALAFGRRRIDPCRSFARGRTALTFSWEELALAPRSSVVLLNPLTAWTGPGA